MTRTEHSSGTEWESEVGYSRAVRLGDQIHVSGTTATDEDGQPVAAGDPYAQCERALDIVSTALTELGAGPEDVVRTRLYVTDVDHWEDVGQAHAEAFGEARPASTMVEVDRLIHPDLLVEVEATAVLEG